MSSTAPAPAPVPTAPAATPPKPEDAPAKDAALQEKTADSAKTTSTAVAAPEADNDAGKQSSKNDSKDASKEASKDAPKEASKDAPEEVSEKAPAKNTASPKVGTKKTDPTKSRATPEPAKKSTLRQRSTPEPTKTSARRQVSTPEPSKKDGARPRKTPEPSKKEGSTPTPSEGDAKEGSDETDAPTTLRDQFRAFSRFGDSKSDGRVLTLSQSDKWMKQAGVVAGVGAKASTFSTTDTAIAFKKYKQMKLSYPDYDKYLTDLCKGKGADLAEIKEKMRSCGTPGTRGTTSVVKGGVMQRLTDSTGYTGSHRERFDGAGRGRGGAGRRDDADKSGYVSGYKHKDTYSKTH